MKSLLEEAFDSFHLNASFKALSAATTSLSVREQSFLDLSQTKACRRSMLTPHPLGNTAQTCSKIGDTQDNNPQVHPTPCGPAGKAGS